MTRFFSLAISPWCNNKQFSFSHSKKTLCNTIKEADSLIR